MWEGVIKEAIFNKWKTIIVKSEIEGKRALAEKGVEFFFDMALNFNPTDAF